MIKTSFGAQGKNSTNFAAKKDSVASACENSENQTRAFPSLSKVSQQNQVDNAKRIRSDSIQQDRKETGITQSFVVGNSSLTANLFTNTPDFDDDRNQLIIGISKENIQNKNSDIMIDRTHDKNYAQKIENHQQVDEEYRDIFEDNPHDQSILNILSQKKSIHEVNDDQKQRELNLPVPYSNRKLAKSDIYKIYMQGEVGPQKSNQVQLNGIQEGSSAFGTGFESYRISGSQMLKSMKNKMKQQMLKKHLTQVVQGINKSMKRSIAAQIKLNESSQMIIIQEATDVQSKPQNTQQQSLSNSNQCQDIEISRNQAKIINQRNAMSKNMNSTSMILQNSSSNVELLNEKQDILQRNALDGNFTPLRSFGRQQTMQEESKQEPIDIGIEQKLKVYQRDKNYQGNKITKKASKAQKKKKNEHIFLQEEAASQRRKQIDNQLVMIQEQAYNHQKNYYKVQEIIRQKDIKEKQADLTQTSNPLKVQGNQEQESTNQSTQENKTKGTELELLSLRKKSLNPQNFKQSVALSKLKSPFNMTSTHGKFNFKLTKEQEKLLKEYQQFLKRVGPSEGKNIQEEIDEVRHSIQKNQKIPIFQAQNVIQCQSTYYKLKNIFSLKDEKLPVKEESMIKPQQLQKIAPLNQFHSTAQSTSASPFKLIQQDPEYKRIIQSNSTQAQAPKETKIKILNTPLTHLKHHPINVTIRLLNNFMSQTLVKAQQVPQQKNVQFDQSLIQNLARQLSIELPKNQILNAQLFKSKNFIIHAKEMILRRLFSTLNEQNQVELNFERSQFQFYKAYVGRGNNAQLILQLFKNNRWWWNVYQNLQVSQEGEFLLPPNCKDINTLNMNLYKEDFKEHNFIWTQWKKHRHFSYLKPVSLQINIQNQQQKENQGKQNLSNIQDQSNARPGNISNDMKIYAKLENNFHLSNKCAMFYNMMRYYEAIQRDPFEVIPLTFHIKQGIDDPQYYAFQKHYKDIEERICIDKAKRKKLKETNEQVRESLPEVQNKKLKAQNKMYRRTNMQFNHIASIEGSPKILSQDDLDKAASIINTPPAAYKKLNFEVDSISNAIMSSQRFSSIDRRQESFTKLPAISMNNNNSQMASHKNAQSSTSKLPAHKHVGDSKVKKSKRQKERNIWIVKPGENTNRGNGITVCQKLQEVKSILTDQQNEYNRTFIIQKYMENPALYKNRKFDIRCYGMMTSINGHQKGYFYEDGYIRTSSREYNLKKIGNKLIHLTNDAVQKKADDYGKYETGNKVSFKEYQSYLNETHPDLQIDFMRDIFLSQIKRIITDTFRATYKSLDPKKYHHSFEVFGYDFMLDHDFRVSLIEVNTNPCIETTCPILQRVITDMVDSGLRIALDPLFPPPNYNKRVNIQQIPLTQWELVYDGDIDSPILDKIFEEHERKNDLADEGEIKLKVKDLEKALIIEEDQEDDFD